MKSRRIQLGRAVNRRGAALVEFAFILPLFLTFMLGVLEIAKALQVSNELTSAIREGGRLGAMEWEGMLQPNITANQKVTNDIKNFLAATGIPSNKITVSITSAEGADEGTTFNLQDPNNKLRLFRITASVPFSAINAYPSHFMAGETVKSSLVFRAGGKLTGT